MPKTASPLSEMTEAFVYDSSDELKPDESFLTTALPGFKDALSARRAIRIFDGEPIPEGIMRDCLRDATLAPSASNLQPYELYWVRNEKKRVLLADDCLGQPAATTAGELIVVVARKDLWNTNREKLLRIMTADGAEPLVGPLDEYYNHIVPMLRTTDTLGVRDLMRRVVIWFRARKGPTVRTPVSRGDHRVWANVQSSLAAQTLMLSLSAHGYDSCPMGGIDKLRIRRLLGLPRGADVSMVISAGRRRPEGLYGRRIRLDESDLIKVV